ncbi:hypothetical protein BU16DRAFT_277859 [Lophium mytilinum]|uniref:Uncharacterized protein n=1 Tax=Lophium mytilinum TaxID=390894 RepID=A0A6A6R4F4_9PEZI|nr:hypothetical protein BU16DRAFT_277859 [Lophium mytilinum]
MNAHGLAYGSWSRSIPLFPGPGAHKVPWGLLWCLPAYIWLGVGAAIFGCSLLDALRRKFPGMSTMASYAVVQAAYYSIFFCLATFWNRHQVYTYVSAPRALTAWYGEVHQLPLYEPFLIGLYCWGYTWLRLSRDAAGRCAIDREVDGLQISRFQREVLSTLAVCGWATVVTVVAYMVPFSWLSMLGDGHPVLPSFLQQGIWCGQPGGPLCPGQMLGVMRERGV